jgi:hypothetical protein
MLAPSVERMWGTTKQSMLGKLGIGLLWNASTAEGMQKWLTVKQSSTMAECRWMTSRYASTLMGTRMAISEASTFEERS